MHSKTVIIGGGFAGLQACKALGRLGMKVLLIDPSPVTTMLPSLPDLAGGWISPALVQRPLSDLLPGTVNHLRQTVSLIDLEGRVVKTENETIPFDRLLIAAGSRTRPAPEKWPRRHLYSLATLDDALRIRDAFPAYLQQTQTPHLLVAGTGYTGLELAMSLYFRAKAERKTCAVTLVDPTPVLLPSLPDKQRHYVLDFLQGHGVQVRLGNAVDEFDGQTAVIGGQPVESPFFCWAAGSVFAVPEIKGRVESLRDGRLPVSPDLSLPGYPRIFAAGDAAAIVNSGKPLRKAVNFAFYGGRAAGRNIGRQARGKPTRPFRPVDLGWVVPFHTTSIGRIAPGLWIRGRIGVRLHHLMCGIRNYSFANFAGCLKLALNPYPKGNHS